jgi:calcium-dependent protein kinase
VKIDTALVGSAILNLQKFTIRSQLQNAALQYMVFQLSTKEELENLANTFKMIDINGNGQISKDELLEGYKAIYGDIMGEYEIEMEVDMLWDQVDVDGSGEIDYTEWALSTVNKEVLLTDKRLRQAFSLFDLDNSGFITAEELQEVLDPLTDTKTSRAEWKKVIMDIDGNGDGQISFEEFKNLMREIIMGNSEFMEKKKERDELGIEDFSEHTY